MKKSEFRQKVRDLFSEAVEDLSHDERLSIVRQCMIDFQEQIGWDQSNKGNEWSDEELRVVLQHAPTKENTTLLARAFRRGYGSIEQIFRWAASSDEAIVEKGRADDSHIQKIKRIAKEVGWRAIG